MLKPFKSSYDDKFSENLKLRAFMHSLFLLFLFLFVQNKIIIKFKIQSLILKLKLPNY